MPIYIYVIKTGEGIVKKLALTNLNIYNAYTNTNFVALFII